MQLKQNIIIAIDGYSSCGKSTFAKNIAKELDYLYIDSGAMYRAVTLYGIKNNLVKQGEVDSQGLIAALDDMVITFKKNELTGLSEICLNGIIVEKEIRSLEVSENVSPVSIISEVRRKMVALQREMAKNKGVVMDGRDIGTVVFPDAEIKIFMTADVHIRAERRFKELIEKNIPANFQEVEKNIRTRDYIDENREDSPLRKADDAILLDNSSMTPEEQMLWFRKLIKSFLHNHLIFQ